MIATSSVLCIDGPSGAGKGTVSQAVAEKLGFRYLDSGAIYRVLAVLSVDENLSIDQMDELVSLARTISVEFVGDQVLYRGADISSRIRNEQTGALASKLASHTEIRQALLQAQRNYAVSNHGKDGLVADGRDMGTVVFPDAPVKIYLTASAEERAHRRFLQLSENARKTTPENSAKQLIDKEDSDSLRALLEDIKARDERDSNRKTSPLRPAEDAILIDSTSKTIEEVVSAVLSHWNHSA